MHTIKLFQITMKVMACFGAKNKKIDVSVFG
jgi:hypothetical protein